MIFSDIQRYLIYVICLSSYQGFRYLCKTSFGLDWNWTSELEWYVSTQVVSSNFHLNIKLSKFYP